MFTKPRAQRLPREDAGEKQQKGRSRSMHPSRLGRTMRHCVMMTVVAMMMAGRGESRRRDQHQKAGNRELLHGLILTQSGSTPRGKPRNNR